MAPGERIFSIKWMTAPAAPRAAPDGAASGQRVKTSARCRFDAIFDRYETAVYDYICGLVGSAGEAHDLTQDTFLRVYLALPTIPDDARIGAWVFRTATSVCLAHLRRRARVTGRSWAAFVSLFRPHRSAEGGAELAFHRAGSGEELPLLPAELPAHARACLLLRERHRLSYDEIAEALDTTRASVQSFLFHAREACRRRGAVVAAQPGHLLS
jgi:RNA polymerase sigma-70 factor, ECF subfamily